METLEFKKLINKRENCVEALKENNFGIYRPITGYSDPSHFVFEILQNAEDAGANRITFELYQNRLEIFHDGKNFAFEDVEAITGIGNSTKEDDINAIGKFGIGFKSVFTITETPIIHSGQYHFKIRDFIVPSPIEIDSNIPNTQIILPFKHKPLSQEEIFALIQKKLESLELQTLLFLRNVKKIQWKSPNKGGYYRKSVTGIEKIPASKRVTIIAGKEDEETRQYYFIFEKLFELDSKQLKVEIAFQLNKDNDNKEIIVPVENSKLIVYFPTEKLTSLKFLIQGPYKTIPNRENIPLNDEQNKLITQKIGGLVADSISIMKTLGYLDLNFLNILPLKEPGSESPIYSIIYEHVKTKLSSDEKLLPTNNSQFTTVSNALLARGQVLAEIFTKDDIKFLFEKDEWLDTNITYDREGKLRNYLVHTLDIQEVSFEEFAKKFTTEFFATKDDNWMAGFYGRLNDQRALWKDGIRSNKAILRTKPIIRLEDGSHKEPFDNNGKVLVYLPSETKSEYCTVKKTIFTQNEVAEFLKALGLSEPDLFAEIREFIIPKYKIDKPNVENEEYFEDFHKLLSAFKKGEQKQQQELLLDLQDLYVIKTINLVTEQNDFLKPGRVYANNKELKLYFKGYESAFFVSDALHLKFKDQELDDFLKKLGITILPRRVFTPDLSEAFKFNLRKIRRTREIKTTNYRLDGLEHFLEQPITLERSKLLWQLLVESIERKNEYGARKFFEGEYEWFYHASKSCVFDTCFIETLRQNCWLFDNQDNFRCPSDITFSELSNEYNTDCSNIGVLKEKLSFKPNILKQLPEKEQKILEIFKGRSFEDIQKVVTFLDKQANKDEEIFWEPETEADKADINKVEDLTPDVLKPPNIENQTGALTNHWNNDTDINKPDIKPKPELSSSNKRSIGKWGEQYVFETLKEQLGKEVMITETDYGFHVLQNGLKIYWLNIKKEIGKGCDFVIKREDKEIEYIEVKTTTEGKEAFIEITGTQWEFARKLFNKGEGDKYIIYRVFNAGQKSNTQIKRLENPIKLWNEGRLYAHPIHLKL